MAAHNRRRFLSSAGATLGVALAAGCLGEDEGDDEGPPEPVVDVAETTVSNTDPDAWRDVESIRLDGYVGGWVGVEPDHVDRVENPTLVLFEDREYEITWQNRDGVRHDLVIWDDEGEIVDDYATEPAEEVGATETLRFVATPEMAQYVCEHQRAIQFGDLEILEG